MLLEVFIFIKKTSTNGILFARNVKVFQLKWILSSIYSNSSIDFEKKNEPRSEEVCITSYDSFLVPASFEYLSVFSDLEFNYTRT